MNILKSVASASVLISGIFLMTSFAYAEDFKLKFQSANAAGSPEFAIQKAWAAELPVLTGSRVSMEILPVKSVVEYNETQDAVASGILDGHIADMSYWAGKDPAFGLLGNPVGAWASPEQLYMFMNYGGGLELANELLGPYGLHMIGAITPGLEAFVSKVSIKGVADLKGIKMRAPEGLVQEVFAAAGAAPVNLPFSEVFTSLEKGVIDAADATVFAGNQAQGLNDVALNPVYPGFHSMPTVEVSINKATWDKMPEDLQTQLEVAVRDLAYKFANELSLKDREAIAEAQSIEGLTIHNWPPEERAKFREIAVKQWAVIAGDSANAKKVYDSLVSHLNSQGLIAN